LSSLIQLLEWWHHDHIPVNLNLHEEWTVC
jgi:hypothetical protein